VRHLGFLIIAGALGWVPGQVFAGDSAPAVEREYINVSEARPPGLPFSDAVLAGDTLYISGAGGFDPATGELPEDPAEEARLLMESFKATLAAAGMTMDDLVSVTVYCPDLNFYDTFNAVYRTYFEGDFPARAFIGSGPLLFGMRFEMQGTAVR
jgi:enamine deaminase RidA (YjgF/YER057c/UK114 family)